MYKEIELFFEIFMNSLLYIRLCLRNYADYSRIL